MHFLSPALEDYINRHSEPEPLLLQELSRETHLKVLHPRMITGHFQGRVLSFLSKLLAPKYILEIGTYTGYAAICLTEGLQKEGELHTIEMNEELSEIQEKYFQKSGVQSQIVRHFGNALDIIPTLDYEFDLVFIDAEKKEYLSYLEAIMQKVKQGSIILSDNVLWSGKVITRAAPKDKATQVLQAYNKILAEDPRFETLILPIRDGLTLSRVL